MSANPKRIICFSGKRKSGKDYIADLLHKRLAGSVVIRLSAPIKQHWAESMNLDLTKLLSDEEYKENYRAKMIEWGEDKRSKDPNFFCRSAIQMCRGHEYSIWIVSDMRRTSDWSFFHDHYPGSVTTVRIKSSDAVRVSRGFVFVPGIDDAESECGLDHVIDWDFVIQNDGDESSLETDLRRLTNYC
nr:EOG090X0FYC [Eurycercus lamellatus]